jgi:bis(5'-nucleosidyl)-tetraphosphatase
MTTMELLANFFYKSFRLFFTFSDQAYGIIPVYKKGKQKLYLVVLSKSDKWVFAKGHALIGEDEISAAKRELKEETGVVVEEVVKNQHFDLSYTFKLLKFLPISKKVKFFAGFTKKMDVKIDQKELKDYKWATLDESLNLLTFKNSQEMLKKVDLLQLK